MSTLLMNQLVSHSLILTFCARPQETEASGDQGTPRVGCLLHYLMHTHLACPSDASPLRPSIAEETSRFLQAICIRSAEGRRRIIAEVVKTVKSAAVNGKTQCATVNMPFLTVDNGTPGHKVMIVLAYVSLSSVLSPFLSPFSSSLWCWAQVRGVIADTAVYVSVVIKF